MNCFYKIGLWVLFIGLGWSTLNAQGPLPQSLEEKFIQAEQKVVLLENINDFIPLQRLDSLRIAYLPIGFDTFNVDAQPWVEGQVLEQGLAQYSQIHTVKAPADLTETQADQWITDALASYNLIILGLKNYTLRIDVALPWKKFDALIGKLCEQKSTVAVVIGRRMSADWPRLQEAKGILAISHVDILQQSIAAQIIFGGLGAQARLPFQLAYFPQGSGYTTKGRKRFAFIPPKLAGMNGRLLEDSIRTIVEEGIREGAFPGAQVLVAKDGQVVYHETFGHHTYEAKRAVDRNDLYDFASITKITGPLPALMHLHGQGKFDLDASLQEYIKVRKRSNKAHLSFRAMLAHHAKLRPYIPYWIGTLASSARYPWQEGWNMQAVNDENFRGRTFRIDSTRNYNIKINDRLWLHRKYRKKMYKAIDRSPLNEKEGYVYSGLLFFLLPDMITDLSGMDYEAFLKKEIYHPLGAYTLTYNPLRNFPLDRIVPTERDTFFRHQLVQGSVHDEGAAMMGGVSGNAGLFGTTLDLAKLMQMYLNYGTYGGEKILPEATLKEFTRCQYCDEDNRRGLGFDKPPVAYPEEGSYMAKSASALSFGHSGFTGTYTWADPENGLLLVFMSNRVYPSRDRRKLYELGIRPRLHQVLYDAVEEY